MIVCDMRMTLQKHAQSIPSARYPESSLRWCMFSVLKFASVEQLATGVP
jgi:hypothetical protein